jgi:hypothetical protein
MEYYLSGSRLVNLYFGCVWRIGGYVAPKRHVLLAAISSFLVLAFCMFVFWVVFARPSGTMGMTIAVIVAQATAFGVAPFVALFIVFAGRRKPLRPPNYPRIEHLRIAGKYQAARRFPADSGVSPLHLKG